MANFERLIRGALASQDASSAEVRQRIYQSSRNALQKIIENNRSLTLESVMEQKRRLEVSIDGIEAEFNPLAPAPLPIEEQQFEVPAEIIAEPVAVEEKPEEFMAPPPQVPETDPLHEIQQILESTTTRLVQPNAEETVALEPNVASPSIEMDPEPSVAPSPDPQLVQTDIKIDEVNQSAGDPPPLEQDDYYEEQENLPLGFSKRRKTQKRFFWTLITLLILGLLAWMTYFVVAGILDGSILGQNDSAKENPNAISRQADSENYITVIEASDLSSLVMSGRGKAQIVKELNSDMIRVNSVRDALNRAEPALPILIKLKPGVLKQISGKRVTVEIFAKSGGGETAHFAVGCEFGSLTECERKRFLAGSQPIASVFAFQMDTINDISQDMYLTLSTDTTSQAAVTGKGDVLDIVYIRLSVDS